MRSWQETDKQSPLVQSQWGTVSYSTGLCLRPTKSACTQFQQLVFGQVVFWESGDQNTHNVRDAATACSSLLNNTSKRSGTTFPTIYYYHIYKLPINYLLGPKLPLKVHSSPTSMIFCLSSSPMALGQVEEGESI
jgi:hypothetical protein